MSDHNSSAHPPPRSLRKQQSWSPDLLRDETWWKLKANQRRDRRRSQSVTDEDLTELKACIELGFGFDSPEVDRRLSNTFPALEFYCAVNRLSRSPSSSSIVRSASSLSIVSCNSDSNETSDSIIDPDAEPEEMKARLRQWAQIVACSVLQSSPLS